jgi:hypothetical protein
MATPSGDHVINFRITLPATIFFTVFMLVIYLLGVKAVTYEQVREMDGTTAVTQVEPSPEVLTGRQQIATLLKSP